MICLFIQQGYHLHNNAVTISFSICKYFKKWCLKLHACISGFIFAATEETGLFIVCRTGLTEDTS